MNERRLPRIKDVAEMAGVSTATVSRTLTRPDKVSEATRAAVFAAVEKTGYMVNQMARNLRRRQTGAVVVLVPNLGNPFFSSILAGIEWVCARAGYSVLIADTSQPQADRGHIFEYLHNGRADGLVVLDGTLPRALLEGEPVRGVRPPVVFACEWMEGLTAPSVTIDNQAGAALAVGHLADLGHRAIGHVAGPAGNVLTETRLKGTRRALAARSLAERPEWFFDGDFSPESGAAAARAWLGLAERPTGIFCASDMMAFGFMSELHRRGVGVPGDVSVVGFDDIDVAARFIPALTTVRQPREAIGETAARLLLARIGPQPASNGAAADPGDSRVLAVELVARESTRRLAGR